MALSGNQAGLFKVVRGVLALDRKSAQEVKDWLGRYRDAKRNCWRLEREYDELVGSQESVGAVKYSDMPKAFGVDHDLSDLMVKRDWYLKRIIKARSRRDEVLGEISQLVDKLERQEQRDVISMRYLQIEGYNFSSWDKIAEEIGYSREHVARIHGAALARIEKLLQNIT